MQPWRKTTRIGKNATDSGALFQDFDLKSDVKPYLLNPDGTPASKESREVEDGAQVGAKVPEEAWGGRRRRLRVYN